MRRSICIFMIVLSCLWAASCGRYAVPDKTDLLVPVSLDGWDRTYWMILDTGMQKTRMNEHTLAHLMYKEGVKYDLTETREGAYSFTSSGTLGRERIFQHDFLVEPEAGKNLPKYGKGVIGTLGMDVLENRITVIDFSSRTAEFYPAFSELDKELQREPFYTDISLNSGKVVVPFRFGRREYPLYYDPRAGEITLMVAPALWTELTGINTKNSSLEELKGELRGISFTAVGAPCEVPIEIGAIEFRDVTVYRNAEDTLLFPYDSYGTVGVLGNGLFEDDAVIVLDLIQNRFGLFRN